MSKANEEIDYVERACALAPEIEARADQIEQERRLPEPVLAALFEAGLFRLLLPRSLDGVTIQLSRGALQNAAAYAVPLQ